jgi:hypothetical protein
LPSLLVPTRDLPHVFARKADAIRTDRQIQFRGGDMESNNKILLESGTNELEIVEFRIDECDANVKC